MMVFTSEFQPADGCNFGALAIDCDAGEGARRDSVGPESHDA
jgi:hypothetical protein